MGHVAAVSPTMDLASQRHRIASFVIYLLFFAGTVTILILLGVVLTMVIYGGPFLTNPRRMLEIVTSTEWFPSDDINEGRYGALAMIWGSFFVGIPAIIFSITLGVTTAIFLSEFVPERITRIIQPIVEFVAAIPSVIFGVIAFLYLSQWIKQVFNVTNGRGPLNASITLALMSFPIIVSISIDALRSTPAEQRVAAKAFGATRWEIFRNVSFPHAKYSIFASVVLAFGRILGETMVVLMVLGNSPVISWDFFGSAYTLTSAIAVEIGDARFGSGEFRVLFILALILLAISFLVMATANAIINQNPLFFKLIRTLAFPLELLGRALDRVNQALAKEVVLTQEHIIKRIKYRKIRDWVYGFGFGFLFLTALTFVGFYLGTLLADGVKGLSINFLITFPTSTTIRLGQYGIYGAIIGSLSLVAVASLIAFPISTATGIYLNEFAPKTKMTNYIRLSIMNISSIPSIVVGLFVYGAFSVALNWERGILPGGIALGVMMIPIVTTNTIEALRNTPDTHRVSALALGMTNWEAVRFHKLPYAFPNIITGYILAIARVIGETAPLLLVAAAFTFSTSPYPSSLIRNPIRALTYEVYYNLLFTTNAKGPEWALNTAVVLLAIVAILNVVAYFARKLIRSRYEYHGKI